LSDAIPSSAFVEAVEKLNADVCIPGSRSLGISPVHFDWIAERAVLNNSNDSNPRPMGAGVYRQVLDGLAAA
jgi:alcohol dehydrogenase class IV